MFGPLAQLAEQFPLKEAVAGSIPAWPIFSFPKKGFPQMKPYRIFGHTADIGIDVRGKTPEDVFINSAKAMFEIIADTSGIKSLKKVKIAKHAPDYDELLREWLSELHYLYSVKQIVFGEFVIKELNDKIIKAIAFGQN